jgi:NAD(P)-dependent dehydrogenase (short-subunit alcohol dehydrogenase family)
LQFTRLSLALTGGGALPVTIELVRTLSFVHIGPSCFALAANEAERIVLARGTAIGIACDVADEAQVAAMVDRAVAEYGRLDMAFNNAGIQVPPSDAADEPIEHFERVTAVNQRGVWACMKHELRVMRDQGSGAIVNCSSLGGLVGLPQRAAYHGTKHAVLGMTKSAGVEYAPRGIRINAVCPGTSRARDDRPCSDSWISPLTLSR